MELRNIDKYSKDKKEIKEIFLEAFPKEERPPYFVLQQKAKNPNVDFNGIYDGGKVVGLAYAVKGENICYLFFLAIKNSERGHGYGSKVMEILKEKYKDYTLFLALETLDKNADNYKQRLSRHNFYERCGLKDMPYQIKEGSIVYDVMGTGGEVSLDEYKKLIDDYLGKFMKLFIDMKLFDK